MLLYKADAYSEDLLQQQVECLHQILINVENDAVFCNAHELVTRTKITSKRKTILKAVGEPELKPFYFLVNKN